MDITALANFGLVLLFVLIGGLFAGTEMAIVNLREAQIQKLEKSGERGASTARLVRDPNLFLSAVQIGVTVAGFRSEEHTSELQSRGHLVCRLLLEKKKYRGSCS